VGEPDDLVGLSCVQQRAVVPAQRLLRRVLVRHDRDEVPRHAFRVLSAPRDRRQPAATLLDVRSSTPLRWLTLGLAAMHLLPATHHLGRFFAEPSIADAWKGFGAVGAAAFLSLPTHVQARWLAVLWRRRVRGAAIAFALAFVHVVPASDHVPRFMHQASFGDGWRAVLTVSAIVWFAAPTALQQAVLRTLGRLGRRSRRPLDAAPLGAPSQ
jgi:hypothetical protein